MALSAANFYHSQTARIGDLTNASYLDLMNRSTKVCRIYRIALPTVSTSGNTAFRTMNIRRVVVSGGGNIQPIIPYSTLSPPVDASITCGFSRSITALSTLRRVLTGSRQAVDGGLSWSELQASVPFSELFSTVPDSDLEPLVCRNGDGVDLFCPSDSGSVIGCHAEMDFTIENS